MSQLVYFPNMSSEPVQYYAAEAVHRAPMQPMTFLYPSAAQSVATPPQPQHQPFPPSFAASSAPYYIYQNGAVEVPSAAAGNNFVYLLPSAPAANAGQMSMLIQSNNSSCSGMSLNQPMPGCDLYGPTPMLMSQQQQQRSMTYIPMPAPSVAALKTAQPMLDPATKLALLRSPEVCRHYLNGRCNRRKCRFQHPDLQHPTEPAMMTYIATDPNTPALSRTSPTVVNAVPATSSLTSSENSFAIAAAAVGWNGQLA